MCLLPRSPETAASSPAPHTAADSSPDPLSASSPSHHPQQAFQEYDEDSQHRLLQLRSPGQQEHLKTTTDLLLKSASAFSLSCASSLVGPFSSHQICSPAFCPSGSSPRHHQDYQPPPAASSPCHHQEYQAPPSSSSPRHHQDYQPPPRPPSAPGYHLGSRQPSPPRDYHLGPPPLTPPPPPPEGYQLVCATVGPAVSPVQQDYQVSCQSTLPEDPHHQDPAEAARYSGNVSPPVFRLSEVCSPVPGGSETQFPSLDHAASSPSQREDSAASSFRLSDLSEPGYKLDLQSGQLQIHLDLSTGDVINLTSLPEAGSPGGAAAEQDSSYVQPPAYYEMSTSVSAMDDTEAAQSVYPYFNTASGGGGNGGASAAAPAASNTSSSPYNLSNRYSDLYSPSLYSQYYQSGYPSWAGTQTPGKPGSQ